MTEIPLHDAEILSCAAPSDPFVKLSDFPFPEWLRLAVLNVKQNEKIVTLIYALDGQLRKHPSQEPWPFSKEAVHWLYDELDVASDVEPRFVHRILLSDGVILEIPFTSVLIQESPLPASAADGRSKQIA